jgi:zinc and cadmium transporter
MTTLNWIVLSGVAMSAIALVGGVALVLGADRLERILLPLVAFAAGTLLGGALLHMLPGAIDRAGSGFSVYAWLLAGFIAFFALEQFMHWHHSHRPAPADQRRPLTYLVLVGDGLHNLLGGLAVGGAFVADVRLGIGAWLAAAAHEVPQELGDFGVLVHGGWSPTKALLFNVVSASTFLLGSLLAYAASARFDVSFLLAFAAGNFLYIAASDLVPEVKTNHGIRQNLVHLVALVSGVALLFLLRLALE